MGIPRKIIEGQPVLVVVDIQNGETRADGTSPIPRMPGRDLMVENAMKLIKTARYSVDLYPRGSST
jgi:nicotinamidase-related amidase